MPVYIYECQEGHRQEAFYRIANKPKKIKCHCGSYAKQIPAIGGIETDSPTWLNDEVRGALQDDDLLRKGKIKPIETRGEWDQHLKDNGLVCLG